MSVEAYGDRVGDLAGRQAGIRQHIEIALASPKWVFWLGETLTMTTLIGL
jgi:hypothetical protein